MAVSLEAIEFSVLLDDELKLPVLVTKLRDFQPCRNGGLEFRTFAVVVVALILSSISD